MNYYRSCNVLTVPAVNSQNTRMKIFRVAPLAITATAILFVVACKKDDLPDAGGQRISKITIDAGFDSTGSILFKYDNNGKLESTTNTFRNIPQLRTLYYYDATGKLTTTEQVSLHSTSVTTNSYFYDGSNLVNKVYSTNDFSYRYTYNATGKLIADTVHGFSISATFYTNFLYTGDNLTEWRYYHGSHATGWQTSGSFKATYTNSDNPFYAIGLLYFITGADLETGNVLLSKQLVSRLEHPNGEIVNYSYDYYSNGLPKRVTMQSATVASYRRTIDFYYE